ncbi:EmrB/QacA subfamily drug resistance transporter [Paraburkholderia sp. BL6669N2]|uniref:DHA2 family efflux MFS transporter permease subunit n=1 Tax=Paraburkholderia sp. BL6669N2 TaxID=1938807 RepID=UPI000E238B9E|nr:DHA2 family efflux MFS transporter permease subunit [Paraburkholderia sp. BL6669N2]REG49022.1 EmrB/QacA subfamily drug resistance transporter [Paraburkholderia sp. BL6669N2]
MSSTVKTAAARGLDPRVLRIAAVVILGSFMSILDTTIVNVGIQELSRTFGVSLSVTQWVSTGYMLALATVIPLTGWAADRFGTKRLYIGSILLFVIGSALCGVAWSATSLIAFRVLQGLGGGMIMPAGLTILSHAAGGDRMGRVLGIVGVPMLLAPIVGPILGGWFVDDVSWRCIFFVNVPIGVIALFAGTRVLERDEPRPHHALDWRGLVMLSPGLAIFVYGLAQTASAGSLKSVDASGGVVVGLALTAAFVWHAKRREGALIDVRLFMRRTVGSAALTMLLLGSAFFGTALLLPLYFQLVRGESAFHAGLLIAAQGVGAVISMPTAARVTDRIGPGRVVLIGLILVGLAMLSLTQIQSDTSLWIVEGTLFVLGLGMGATMMPTMSAALAPLRRHEIARVTSGMNVAQRVGGSIGTALLAVVLSQQIEKVAPVTEMSETGVRAMRSMSTNEYAAMLPALGRAFGHTFVWPLGIITLGLVVASFLPRRRFPDTTGVPPVPNAME